MEIVNEIDDSSSQQTNSSISTIAPEKHASSSCTAKIVIGPLPPKRIRKRESNEPPGRIIKISFGNPKKIVPKILTISFEIRKTYP